MRKLDLSRLKTTEAVSSNVLSFFSSTLYYANSSANGVVKLVDSTSNSSATAAASANSVKVAYDLASGAATGAVANGAAAYANGVTYTNAQVATGYANAVSHADTVAATAYANAYYWANALSSAAYSNAITYAASNTYVNTQLGYKASLDGATFTGAVLIANSANVSGSLQVGGVLTVVGNLVVNGTTTTVDTSTIAVSDSLIYLAANNEVTDSLDIGFVAHYNTGPGANGHTGLVRSSTTKKYYLFQNYQPEFGANNTVDFANTATGIQMADLVVGNLTANSILSAGNTSINGTLNTSGLLTANVITVSNVSATQQNLQVDAAGTATAMAIVFGG